MSANEEETTKGASGSSVSAGNTEPSGPVVTLPLHMLRDILEGNKTESMKWREMVESERLEFSRERKLLARERQRYQRWTLILRSIFFGGPVLLGVLWLLFAISRTTDWSFGPLREVLGIVHINGEIRSTGPASANKIVSALERAFADENTKAVVLKINSPGGLPLESERINAAIARLKQTYDKPVIAVIENVGASAAYMIAMHADEVYAGRYSLVGSVGAIMQGWNVHKAMQRLQIEQRVYTSGHMKAMLNPFTPQTPDADRKAQALVSAMGTSFVEDMKKARGARLKQGVDYGTGEIWYGAEAAEIGLVDGLATIEDLRFAKFGGIPLHDFGPRQNTGGVVGFFVEPIVSAVAAELERLTVAEVR